MRPFLYVCLIVLLFSACAAPKTKDLGSSPLLHDVAEGAIILIAEPFYAGSLSVSFKKGAKRDWWNFGAYDPNCALVFESTPNAEVSEGKYQVEKATYREFAQGDSQFTAITTMSLVTISGKPATTIRCTQSGYYNEGDAGPITVQTFKHTVGRYLKLMRRSECDDPVNQNI
jgi:hypothetical protein